MTLFFFISGLVLLITGAEALVRGASNLAKAVGLSPLIVGLTIVAFGTSAPEMAVSVLAGLAGNADISLGNVVGSNIFNIMAVLGMSAIVASGGIPVSDMALHFDIPIMTVVAIACLPIFFTGNVISRWEGGLFLGYYLAYTLYLILTATRSDILPLFGRAMLGFVIPITAITLLVVFVRTKRTRKKA